MSRRRTTAIIGSSLLTGVALGATGLASAATSGSSSTPPPPPSGSTSTAPVRPDPATAPGGPHRGRPRPGSGPFDLVTAVTASTLSLDTPSGQKTVALTPQTRYRRGPSASTQSSLALHDLVLVRFVDPRATSLVASSVDILPARAEGYVLTVVGNTLTVLDGSGFTRTVTTSAATTYRRAGAPATSAAVTVNAYARVLGAVASDGTTLAASSVEIGLPAKPARPGPRD